jgi:hypothetical protein
MDRKKAISRMKGGLFDVYHHIVSTATIQVQSSRPIYNSSYSSPILNYNDKDFNLDMEFQNLFSIPTAFESNLVSIISLLQLYDIGNG